MRLLGSRKISPRSDSGFTIVELLIVIVVIGILAAISVVAYNGIQQRTTDQSRISAARQTLNLIKMYHAAYDGYPELVSYSSSVSAACLGEGWPEYNGTGVCWNIYDHLVDGTGSYTGSTFVKSDTVDQALSEFGSQIDYPQQPAWKGVHSVGGMMSLNGMVLYRNLNDSASRYPIGYSLVWIIREGGECGVSGAQASPFTSVERATTCAVHLGE